MLLFKTLFFKLKYILLEINQQYNSTKIRNTLKKPVKKIISTNINLLHCAAAYTAVLYRALLCYAVSAYAIFTLVFHLAFSLNVKKFLKETNACQPI
jgi:hypothetical protein